jgi:hypothetical protein
VGADSLWWSVWWQWLAVWTGTVLSLIAAVLIVIVQWRGQQQRSKQPPYVSFYLHDQSVMDLYQYQYRGALEQEVEARVGGRTQVRAGAGVSMVNFGGSLERNREEFRKYLEIAEPITVIGILMDVLEDDLIHIDLQRGSLVSAKNVDIRQRRIRLSELGARTYVLARGDFEASRGIIGTIGPTTTFLAPYGDRASASLHPMIRVRCASSGLRSEVPEGKFWARCLGTVQGWDRVNGQLVIDPIAIFK